MVDPTPAAVEPTSGSAMMDPLSLVLKASGPGFLVVWLLVAAIAAVWAIFAIKRRQIRRWSAAEERFTRDVEAAPDFRVLDEVCRRHPDAPSSPVLRSLLEIAHVPGRLATVAERRLVDTRARLGTLMTTLASIAAAAPFIGLFGTVWGILEAFLRIGRMHAATLPVVAPAIGEALVATALGLLAAIPAVVIYNALAARLDLLLDHVRASTHGFVDDLGGTRGGWRA